VSVPVPVPVPVIEVSITGGISVVLLFDVLLYSFSIVVVPEALLIEIKKKMNNF
jgi:hypothetical protein